MDAAGKAWGCYVHGMQFCYMHRKMFGGAETQSEEYACACECGRGWTMGAVMGGCGACVGWVGMRRVSGELGSWISMNSFRARGRMLSCIGGEN